jgi:hypothetical protein
MDSALQAFMFNSVKNGDDELRWNKLYSHNLLERKPPDGPSAAQSLREQEDKHGLSSIVVVNLVVSLGWRILGTCAKPRQLRVAYPVVRDCTCQVRYVRYADF